MKKIFSSKTFLFHILFLFLLAIAAVIYCKPILEKKRLVQHDLVMSTGAQNEIDQYYKKTGDFPLWTNSMFGGMPSYTIRGHYPNSWTSTVASYVSYILPDPANYIFVLLACFYIAMAALGNSPLQSLLGAIAFGFSSYSLISLEAGHASKVLAVGYAVPIAAGVILIYRGQIIKGALLYLIFMVLELYSNHIQITYYLAIALVVYAIIEFVKHIREKKLVDFLKSSFVLIGISVVVFASMLTRFATMYEYSKDTIRGPSELTAENKESVSTTGLDRDYAFNWSYGIEETFTYLVPNYYGGKSGGAVTENSEIYKTINERFGKTNANKFALAEQWPLYWGDQPGTSGPAYMGAIICLLVVLGMFTIQNSTKWWLLGVAIFFTMLSWGKNFELLNYTFFDHFPLYNKFRAVTMIHALVAMFLVWIAVWGIHEGFKLDKTIFKKYLVWSVSGVGGLLILLWLIVPSIVKFEKSNDEEAEEFRKSYVEMWSQNAQDKEFGDEIYQALLTDRADLFRSDAFRSLLFVVLAGGCLYAYALTEVKKEYILIALIVLVCADEWTVSKRFLNDKDFKRKKDLNAAMQRTSADDMILNDKDPDYRVMNVTVSTFNDASTSYYHKSIGGYSAAKLRRYQDLIDRQISKNNMRVLDMLNTKYFIVQDQQTGEPVAQRNPNALGNAWFVSALQVVEGADAEMKALDSFKPDSVAIVEKKYAEKLNGAKPDKDSAATIKLTSYSPVELTYESSASTGQFAVFSEIYYNSGKGWNAYIDGKPTEHIRTDYILRGMAVPAGKHTITFKFEPHLYNLTETVSLIFSILSILILGVLAWFGYKKISAQTV